MMLLDLFGDSAADQATNDLAARGWAWLGGAGIVGKYTSN